MCRAPEAADNPHGPHHPHALPRKDHSVMRQGNAPPASSRRPPPPACISFAHSKLRCQDTVPAANHIERRNLRPRSGVNRHCDAAPNATLGPRPGCVRRRRQPCESQAHCSQARCASLPSRSHPRRQPSRQILSPSIKPPDRSTGCCSRKPARSAKCVPRRGSATRPSFAASRWT